MIQTKIMTTKQKKFLEKTLKCIDVSLDDFLKIQNIGELEDKIEKQNKVINAQLELIKEQNAQIVSFKSIIEDLVNNYNEMSMKVNNFINESLFNDKYGGDNE